MRLRIISGSLKGRILQCPERHLQFRPTLERTRQAVADMLGPRIGGSSAADLCAGSGSFGFEMISRGAATVDFVEKNRNSASLLREHAEKFGVAHQRAVILQDVGAFVSTVRNRYDIIFFDPPYGAEDMLSLVQHIQTLLLPEGILLYQRRRQSLTGESPSRPFETRAFGDTIVECYGPTNG
jgi:16S rRNA (guanine966-N2)-methyltransferase